MSIRWKALIPSLFMIGVVAALAVVSLGLAHSSRVVNTKIERLGHQSMLVMAVSLDLQHLLDARDQSARTKALTELRLHADTFQNTLNLFRDGGPATSPNGRPISLPPARDPATRAALADAQGLWDRVQPPLSALLQAPPTLEAQPWADAVGPALEALNQAGPGLIDALDRAVAAKAAYADRHQNTAELLVLLSLASVVLIGAAAIFFIEHHLIRPIRRVTKELHKVANRDGDLSRRLRARRRDEIGCLDRSFNAFVAKVEHLVAAVNGVGNEVGQAVGAISGAMQKVSMVMVQQGSQVAEVVHAAGDSSGVVAEVTQRADAAARTAEEAGATAAKTGQTFHAIIEDLSQIRRVVESNADAIQNLDQRSGEIGGLIGLINDIADQTNLLALNAAIEAARAGAHGRGFAVVADEVRKLAERTTQATAKITGSIALIQQDTARAMDAMRQSTDRVRETSERAAAARGEVDHALNGSKQVARLIADISTAARRQSTSTAEVSHLSEQLGRTVEGTAAVASEASGAIEMIRIKASQLSSLIANANLNARDKRQGESPEKAAQYGDRRFSPIDTAKALDEAVNALLAQNG